MASVFDEQVSGLRIPFDRQISLEQVFENRLGKTVLSGPGNRIKLFFTNQHN
jgi:hypothetical protein